MSIKSDLAEFRRTMRKVVRATKKEEADILNKNALKVLIGAKGVSGAVHTTKKTTRARIRADLSKGKPRSLLFRLATKRLKSEGRAVTRENIRATAEQIFKERDRSRAYLAAGWLKPARDLGGKNRPPYPNGGASKSYGVKARPTTLVAKAYNMATGDDGSKAEQIAEVGLNQAIRNATADMNQYLKERVNKVLRDHSD